MTSLRGFPFFLICLEIVIYLSTDMILPALPALTQDLHITPAEAQMTLTAWFMGSASLQLIVGPLADRFGRRAVLQCGAYLFIFTTIGIASTQTLPLILILRFLQGSTVCFITVAGYACIHERYKGTQAIQLLAVMGTVTILAPALGPLVGAIIVSFTHWTHIFWLLSVTGGVAIVGLQKSMPPMQPLPIMSLKPILMDYFSILKNPLFLKYIGIYMACIISFFMWIIQSPFILIEAYGHSTLFFGVAQCFIFSAFMIGGQITKRMIAHTPPHAIIDRGLTLAMASALGMFLVDHLQTQPPVFYLLISMFGVALGSAMLFGLLNRLAIEACGAESMSGRVAVFSTSVSLAAILGSAISELTGTERLSSCVAIAICSAIAIYRFTRTQTQNLSSTSKQVQGH
jgi:Bcr/CflA subfamily drug resistance transporter